MKLLTQEQHDFLVENVKGISNVEMTSLLNARFGLSLRVEQIKCYKHNHRISSGLTGRFVKGQTAPNKGKKLTQEVIDKVKGTWFKKGRVPPNHKPVGSERVNKDGYIEVKVAEPNKWRLKHRVVWEEHFGKIPQGHMVSFQNGIATDCRIENLIMISQQENQLLNSIHCKERDESVVNVVRDICAVRNKIKELTK